jgi:hypothetical protein
LVVDLPAGGRVGEERDAQWARVGTHLVEERAFWRRRGVRVAGRHAVGGVEHRGAVAHGAGHDVLGHQTAVDVAVCRSQRDPASSGLQPEETAARSRDADGASAVVGVTDGDDA